MDNYMIATHYHPGRGVRLAVLHTPANPQGPNKPSGYATAWITSGEHKNKLTTVLMEDLQPV